MCIALTRKLKEFWILYFQKHCWRCG